MEFKEVVNRIKLHLNAKTKINVEYYFDFYDVYLEKYAFNDFDNLESQNTMINKFKSELEDIVEQAEPWNDVKYFKPLDDQLRELLKKYNL